MASKNIKGITIELDGDTKGLDKAISGITKQSVNVAKELKEIEKLLKFNPGNTELLAQKQTLLAKQVGNTSDKLKVLKEAQSQVNAQFQSGTINEEQYRAFQREVQATEGVLRGYQGQLAKLESDQESLAQNTKRLDTFFVSSGNSIDDFSDIIGSRMVSAIKEGRASSDQLEMAINKIGRATIGADGDITQFKNALDRVDSNSLDDIRNDIEKLNPSANEASDSIDEMADSLSSGKMISATEVLADVGDKIMEIGDNAKDLALEFSSAFGSLNATTNLSGQELENLKGIATDVFKSGVTDSIDEAVEATSLMKSAFSDLNNQDLTALTEQVITLSTRTGTDVQENVKGASQLMNAFGLDATSAFDLVASGYQNNLNYSGDFMDTLNEYAPLFSQAGYSADEMLSILQSGMENGAMNTDKTADAVKELQIRLGDGSMDETVKSFGEGTQQAFENWKNGEGTVKDVASSIQEDLKKMTPTEQQQALSLLSTQFEDLGIGAATSLFDIEDGFKDVAGAMDEAAEKDPAQEWQSSLNTFSTSMQEIGAQILEALQPVLDFIADLAEKFNGLSEPIKNFILAFGGVTTIVAILAPIVAAISAIGLTTLGIASAIAVAVGAIILVIQNWGTIVDWLREAFSKLGIDLDDVWNSIKTTITTAVQGIVNFVMSIWGTLVSWWTENSALIQQTASTVWNAISSAIMSVLNVLMPYIQMIWNNILTTISTVWSVIQTVISTAINLVLGIIKAAMQVINGDWTGAWNTIKSTLSDVWSGIQQIVNTGVTFVSSIVSNTFNGLISTVSSAWNGIKDAISTAINGAKSAVSTAIEAIKGLFNFKISWPHIPLPHFSISGSANPLNWLKEGVPKISVDWFAKGGILTKPTVFGMNGGSLMAGGEAGNEAVLPLNQQTLGMIGQGIAEAMNSGNSKGSEMSQLISSVKALANRPIEVGLEIDGRAFAKATSKDIESEINNRNRMSRLVRGERV